MTRGAAGAFEAPLVSVVVPAYNYGAYVGAALESLRAQTLARWECVVVDDGSADETPRVVEEFALRDPRVRLVRQQNRRQAAARNNGLSRTSAPFVQFLDADDLVEPRKLEQQAAYLQSHPEVDIVYGDARFFPTETPHVRLYTMYGEDKPWQPGLSGRGQEMLVPLVRRNTVMIGSALTRRRLIDRVGPFDEALPPVEDWEFWVRCAHAGARFRFEPFPESLSLVRSHAASASKSNLRMAAAEVRMRRKLAGMLTDAEALRANAELLAEMEGVWGAEEVRAGRLGAGVYRLGRAALLERRPRHKLKWLACALAAPLPGRRLFERVYSSSISEAAADALRRLRGRGA